MKNTNYWKKGNQTQCPTCAATAKGKVSIHELKHESHCNFYKANKK